MKNTISVKKTKGKITSSKKSLSLKQKNPNRTDANKSAANTRAAKRICKSTKENHQDIYKDIIENIQEGIFEVDLAGNLTFVNNEVCHATGLTKKKLMGMNSRPFTDKDDDKKVMQAYNTVYKTGKPFRGLGWHIKRKAGEKRYIEGSIYPLKDKSGKVTGFRVIAIDATERKQIEEAHRKAYLEWQETFDSVNDAICLLDSNQRIIRYNKTMKAMFGKNMKDLAGKHCWEVVHGTKKPLPECPIIKSKSSLKREEIELKIKESWFNVVVYPLLDAMKIITAYVHIVTDITKRKKSEESLKDAELKFRTIFDHASDGILLARSSDKMFIEANEKICRMLGYSKEELLQLGISDIHPKESVSNVIEQFIKLLKKEISIVQDLPVMKKDKSIFFADLTASIIDYEGTECLIGMFRDVTERKKILDELRQSRESYRRLFEDHAAVKLIIDPASGLIIDANRAATEYYGWSREKMQQMKISDINTLTSEEVKIEMAKARDQRRSHFEFKHRLANGSIRNVEVYSSAIEMNGKNVLHSIVHDITERKKAEAEIVVLSNALKVALDPILILDLEGKVINENEAAKTLVETEDLGVSALDYVAPEDKEKVTTIMQQLLMGSDVHTADFTLITKSGRRVLIEANGNLIVDSSGKATGFVVVERDVTERKRAEEDLRASEEKFARAFKHSPVDMCITTLDEGRYIDVNDVYLSHLGYTREEIIGRTILDINLWVDLSEPKGFIKELYKTGKATNYELQVRDKQGTIHWGLASASIIKLSGQSCILTQIMDITELKLAEKALRERDERLRGITENLPGVIYQFYAKDTGEYGMSYISEPLNEFAEILSKSDVENLDSVFQDFYSRIHEGDKERFITSIKEATETVSRWNFEGRIFTKSGKMVWIQGMSIPTRLEDQVLFDGIILNINDRKIAEENLSKEQERFQIITEQSSDIIILISPEGKIIYENPSIEKILGYKFQNRKGQNAFENIHSDDLPFFIDLFQMLLKDERPPVEKSEVRIRHADGTWRIFEVVGCPLRIDNTILMIIANLRDITERKEAEEKLLTSESNLRYAQEEAHVGSWEYDVALQKPYWSDEMFRIVGRDPALGPMSLEDFVELVHPDERKLVYRDVAKCYTKNLPYFHEYRIFKPDNKIAFIESRGKAITDDKGNILRISGILQDITERKRMEETLILIKKAVESSSDAIGMSDPQGHHFYHNKAFTELFEYTVEELEAIGGGPAVYVNKDVAREVFENVMKGGSWNGELEMISKSGRKFPVLLRGDAIIDENGKLIGLIGMHTDITESKKAEEELKRIQLLNEALLETVPGILYLYDDTGHLVRWNKQHETLTGFSGDEIKGRYIMDWFGGVEPDTSDIQKGISDVLTKGYGIAEGHLLKKDGSAIFMFFTGVKLKIDGKDHLLGIGVDLTERKKAEEEIIRLNESLEQRVRERTAELEAFSYSVSHDLRAPLRTIHGFGQALLEDHENQLDDEAKGYLGRITRATDTMSDLIEDMLKLSRISRAEMDILPINLSQIVQSIADELRKSQPERRVEMKIADDMQDLADPRLIRIAFENLLSNSWKFTAKNDNARIEFGLTLKDDQKVYFIRDNGAGFDMEYAGKLFTPFQRYHNAEEYAGTGIGLAIVKRIIIRHGGRIWAESKVGEGTAIYFTLEE